MVTVAQGLGNQQFYLLVLNIRFVVVGKSDGNAELMCRNPECEVI
jgi:hypothetical protein